MNDFIAFVKKNLYLAVWGAIAGFLTYGYEMVHFTLTIDEEANWNRDVREAFVRKIADGRFFWGILKQLQPRMLLPFWSTAVFLGIIVLAGIMAVYLYQDFLENAMSKIVLVLLFVTMPTHAFYVMFSMQSPETGLGYVMVIGAAVLTFHSRREKKKIWYYIVPALLVAFAGGIYQAFLLTYAAVACGYLVLWVLKDSETPAKELWRALARQVLFTVCSGILYIVISKFLQFAVAGSRGYVESFVVWGSAPAMELVRNLVKGTVEILFSLGTAGAYCTMFIYSCAAIGILATGLIKLPIAKKGFFALGMLGLAGVNFALSIAAGQILPTRTFLTIPVYASVVIAIMLEAIHKDRLKTAACILTMGLALYQSAVVTDLCWANVRREEADSLLLAELVGQVGEMGHGYIPDIPVIIIADINYASYNGTFGFSYFQLGERVYNYLSYHGIDYIRGDAAQIQEAYAELNDMPVFPAEGSVTEMNGFILVNMLGLEN